VYLERVSKVSHAARVLLAAGLALGACQQEVAPVAVTPVAEAPRPPPPPSFEVVSPPVAPALATPSPLAPPVAAKIVDVNATGARVPVGSRCDVVYVAVGRGALTVAGQRLAGGDLVMARGFPKAGALEVAGSGQAVVVTALHDDCPPAPAVSADAASPFAPAEVRVVRGAETKDLAWAGGTMHARLDLEPEVSPEAYVGRLEGTAPVAEHDHATSWEILAALEGSGTFTLDGVARAIKAPEVVAVPPGRKHSWRPDPGVKLVAVQVYAPPGPEQRFKALAAHGPPRGVGD
jgi:mannose-6-phosphate isomerase-like protein (cupin superfamily)